MNREKIRQGLTLVELILAAVLSVIAIAAVISGYNFLSFQTKRGIGRGNLNLQIDYALEKIRLQCESASAIDSNSLFAAGVSVPKVEFCITGENDPYTIDISGSSNKKKYCYKVDVDDVNGDGDAKDLIIVTSDTSGSNEIVEVLIDSLYDPSITFEYTINSEPNYITAAITATARTADRQPIPIGKKEGIRFWYTTVTQ